MGEKVIKLMNHRINELKKEISAINHELLQKFPLENYLKEIRSSPLWYNYNYISPKLATIFEHIQSTYQAHALVLYHKLALLDFIKESVKFLKRENFPESILELYYEWFERILNDLSIQTDDFYHHQNDPFLKDLGVCSLRLIPIGGAWLVEISRIWKKFLITGGFHQFLKGLPFVLSSIGNLQPLYYQIHTVDRYIQKFTEEERERCYLRIADLLRLHPEIKGMYAASWFYDPALKWISPRLSYLIKTPMQYGAKVFRIGSEEADIKLSLKKSATRRKLYEEGKYMPTRYIIIWTRKDLITWADRYIENSKIESIINTDRNN